MVEPQKATRRPRTQVGQINRKVLKQASEACSNSEPWSWRIDREAVFCGPGRWTGRKLKRGRKAGKRHSANFYQLRARAVAARVLRQASPDLP